MLVKATLSFAVRLPPEPANPIHETLIAFRKAVRYVVNWCIENKIVNLARVHHNLYYKLREAYKLPARLALDAIRQGIWIAKGWLRNPKRGRRPVIRKLSMILTSKQSYTFNWAEASILTVKGRETVPLVYVERWHGKYKDWRVKEARLLPSRLNVVVEKDVPVKHINDVLGLDINYVNLTLSDETRIPVKGFIKALAFKARAEAIQQRYPKKWRYVNGIKKAISRFGIRARNIIKDTVNQLAVQVVKIASQKNSALAVEDLKRLNSSFKDFSRNQRTRLHIWAYKKLLETIEFKAKIEGIPIVKVNPKGTSSKCPICQSKLKENGYRRLKCPSCGFEGDRDYIAALNLKMKAFSGGLDSSQPDATPSRNEGEAGKRGLKRPNEFFDSLGKSKNQPRKRGPEAEECNQYQ